MLFDGEGWRIMVTWTLYSDGKSLGVAGSRQYTSHYNRSQCDLIGDEELHVFHAVTEMDS